jgi:uridylate kinase
LSSAPVVRYPRILLKLSGEALAGAPGFGLDAETLAYVADEVVKTHHAGVQVGIVVGGGNFLRGKVFSDGGNVDRTTADQMGMLATIMNGLAIQAAIERANVQTRVQSAIDVSEVCEPFIRRRAVRHMEKGRVVVFVGGTGNPFFTTDTAAVLRALEIDAKCLVKATRVDGVYDRDPKRFDDAVKFQRLGFDEAVERRLGVMDSTAFTMCQEHRLPVIVLDLHEPNGIVRAARGEPVGTLVGEE